MTNTMLVATMLVKKAALAESADGISGRKKSSKRSIQAGAYLHRRSGCPLAYLLSGNP